MLLILLMLGIIQRYLTLKGMNVKLALEFIMQMERSRMKLENSRDGVRNLMKK